MTDLDTLIRTLSAAHAASTAGEWEIVGGPMGSVFNVLVPDSKGVTEYHDAAAATVFLRTAPHSAQMIAPNMSRQNDAAFIAAAHEHMPALLAALTRVQATLDALDGDAMDADNEYGNGMGHAADRIRAALEGEA